MTLVTLACGSSLLAPKTNLAAFEAQESAITPLFAFVGDLWSSHPRTTKRVIELVKGESAILR